MSTWNIVIVNFFNYKRSPTVIFWGGIYKTDYPLRDTELQEIEKVRRHTGHLFRKNLQLVDVC